MCDGAPYHATVGDCDVARPQQSDITGIDVCHTDGDLH
jgi:hypothetical protein